jgi:hypothetical protein
LRDILFVLFLTIIIGLACPAANAEIQKTGELKKHIEFSGIVAGISEDSLLVAADEEKSLLIKSIINLELYRFPLMAAAERGQPIYFQLTEAGNGNCNISFLHFLKYSLK